MHKIHKEKINEYQFQRHTIHIKINEFVEWLLDEKISLNKTKFKLIIKADKFKKYLVLNKNKLNKYKFTKYGIYFIYIENSILKQTIIVKKDNNNTDDWLIKSKNINNNKNIIINPWININFYNQFAEKNNLRNNNKIRFNKMQKEKTFENFNDLLKCFNSNLEVKL